jgi:hypothetical protein
VVPRVWGPLAKRTMPTCPSVFAEVATLLLLAAGCGSVALLLRQPLIVAFIAVDILVGPAGLTWVHSADQVDPPAKLGIALLLFVVGLNLDVHLIRNMGRVALATGLGQVAFTSAAGFGLCLFLGLNQSGAGPVCGGGPRDRGRASGYARDNQVLGFECDRRPPGLMRDGGRVRSNDSKAGQSTRLPLCRPECRSREEVHDVRLSRNLCLPRTPLYC